MFITNSYFFSKFGKYNKELVELANQYLSGWNINRLGITDGAILKIAIYELLNTPINELGISLPNLKNGEKLTESKLQYNYTWYNP